MCKKTLLLLAAVLVGSPGDGAAATYYVRQTVGDDANDGLSPERAWRSVSRLSRAMQAGDTAYVGPGLYREQVTVMNGGTPDQRVVFIADTTGQHTGDPPGTVMLTGADPVDEGVFVPHTAPGVYTAELPYKVAGVVEMDGAQYRYRRARDTKEHLLEKMSLADVVAKLPSSHFYDEAAGVLHIHTSDGKPPHTHEIELIRRGTGIGMWDKHYVSVMGFTFRHMGDAGISFFNGSGHGIAINNTSYGSRQGIRVYGATEMLIYDNTLFRNDNSGVYFAKRSTNGLAIGNIAYENIKGVRWSSQSVNAMAIENTVFDNYEAGIALEDVDHALLRRNTMVNNRKCQLMVIRSGYGSEDNCFENGGPEQLTADFVFIDHYKTLADYQQGKRQDLHSRGSGCGRLSAKVDVRRLHAETLTYTERARSVLRGSREPPGEATPDSRRGWLEWLLGR
jgi:parallel beta-helix repeat protein